MARKKRRKKMKIGTRSMACLFVQLTHVVQVVGLPWRRIGQLFVALETETYA